MGTRLRNCQTPVERISHVATVAALTYKAPGQLDALAEAARTSTPLDVQRVCQRLGAAPTGFKTSASAKFRTS